MSVEKLTAENADLRRRLEEAEETLRAIQSGAVDALVIEEPEGHRVYTLETADRPYRLFVEQMQQGAATLQADGTIVYCNQQLADLLGLPYEQMVGATLRDFVAADDRTPFDNLLYLGQTHGGKGEVRLRRSDSVLVPTYVTSSSLSTDGRAVIGMLFTDLTNQKHQEILRESEATARRLLELNQTTLASMGEGMYTVDVHGLVTYMNPEAERLFRWRAEELLGRNMHETTHYKHPDGSPFPVEECAGFQVIREGKILKHFEDSFIRKDGSFFPVSYSSSPLRDQAGRIVGLVIVFQDITYRKQAEEERARLAAIVQSSDDAIIGKDLDGIITSWNRGAERLFGYSEEETIGQPVTILMPPDRVDEEPGILERIRRGESIDHYETIRRRKDGTLLDIALTVSPIIDATGKIVGASKIARDITDSKRAEESLRESVVREHEARQEAESANRAKDEFIAIASHELRTPLTPILMSTELLKSNPDPSEIQIARDMIRRNVKLQIRIIEDLLDLNRVKKGKIALEMAEHDLSMLLHSAIENQRLDADRKCVTIEVAGHTQPMRVRADESRIQQIFANILSNAVKFTPEGGDIRVSVAKENGNAIVKVRDTGEGIAPEFLPHVFEMFRQQDNGTSRTHSGLGIGLAIVKSLVDLHGGNIQIYSDGSERGTEVTVTLPLATSAVQPEVPAIPGSGQHSSALQGLVILLVEDSDDTRKAAEIMLKILGAKVFTAAGGREALNILGGAEPEIILSDLAMPGMDGFEFIAELRRVRGSMHPPVIAVSALTTDEIHERTRLAGFAGHLNKPFEKLSLVSAISAVMQAQRAAY